MNALRLLSARQGLTLVELLVVILVLGILLAVALPSYLGQKAKAQDSATKQYLTVAYKAAKAEAASHEAAPGSYPANLKTLLQNAAPELSFVDGTTCADAAGKANNQIVFDTGSSASVLILYGESDSGKVFKLRAPANGPLPPPSESCTGDSGPDMSAAPAVTVPPSANAGSPDPQQGVALTASGGDWTAPVDGANETSHQWQRCSAATSGCTDIPGAASASYTPMAADVGGYLRDQVTVCSDDGCTTTYTASVGPVLPAPPTQTGSPEVSDQDGGALTAQEGQPLSASQGGWAGGVQEPTGYSYQWQRLSGGVWTNILGATASSYTPSAADVDKPLRVCVTATNTGGQTTTCSSATNAVFASAPVNGSAPAAAGASLQPGAVLTAAPGTWTTSAPNGLSYSYQWQRSANGTSGWANVASGGTGSSYTIQSGDTNYYLRVVVTAANQGSGGLSSSTPSSARGPVIYPAPTLSFCCSGSTPAGTSHNASWSSTNATSCSGYGGWAGPVATSGGNGFGGTASTPGTHTYGITCSGPGGSVSAEITITWY